ncbi:hypothetical protein BYT27DRAFT_7256473 [Phlegmacium glaucopus]|nr:hypothetical protein BYT27DRAFT_7256473 [Phlegmacium glaucopus]
MGSLLIVSPFLQSLSYDPPVLPGRRFSASPQSSTPTSARSGHYRPFSTLYTESPYIEIPDKSPNPLKRHTSIGGLQAFAHMGIGFKDRAKAKKNLSPILQVSDPIEVKPSTPQLPPSHYKTLQRPTTSSGVINTPPTLRHVKRKTSMVHLCSSPSPASGSAPHSSAPHSLLSPPQSEGLSITKSISKRTRFLDQNSADHDSPERFVPKSIWSKRHNMKLHPYHHDVPYMQAYDPILLENDRYSDLLLQHLTHGSPSFHDYGKKPPSTVLDLGCGPGYWVLHAASVWKTSQVTGLDLVDVTLPGFETTENAHFVLGNFLAFELPFPDNSFDYVRMANLVLCIPYEKWDYILTEVRRVLTVSGRLELIDDQIFFPYGTAPKQASWSRDMLDAFDDADFDEDTLQDSGSDTGSTLNTPNTSCQDKPDQIVESPTLRPIASYQPPTPVERTGSACLSPDVALDIESRYNTWQSHATTCRELESIFETMLKQKYKIFPRPSDFVLNRMECIFGRDAAGKTKSYHIKLAPVDPADVVSGQGKADGEEPVNLKSIGASSGFSMKTKVWMGMDREKALKKKEKKLKVDKNNSTSKADTSTGSGSGSSSERSSLENSFSISCPSSTFSPTPVPPSTSMKAAGWLGIDFASSPKEKAPSAPLPAPLQPDQIQAPVLSAKAAYQLGISYSDLASATAASISRRSGTSPSPPSPVQSPGLIVWPSTYIPLTPAELEMHANKYVHTLLGCKPALAEFIAQYTDKDGTRFVDDNEFHEVMWKYECFRRSRFNWPSEISDPYDDEPTAVPPVFAPPLPKPKSGSKSNKNSSDSYDGLYHGEELTHIRTIRVFEATKSDRSLASLLFHQKTTPTS